MEELLSALQIPDLGDPVPSIAESESGDEPDEVVMKLSIHAVTGTSCKESVKLQGMIGKTHLLILVDSGSSNSFVSEKLVQQLQCLVEMLPAATVKVAGGGTLTCT